ncbi:dihydropteroate synthase [Patescibacteria group bacterium]|nr:dihydropteroate synthase [Patescibacteria group bacterium]MBU1683795.1 dihydropteroate synthase [Patescibacteria group bacterium]
MDFENPQIMGIVNVTPDSFSDGGKYDSNFETRISDLIKERADIIDIGGESTGPGSTNVSLRTEMNRVKPVIDYIAKNKLTEKVLFSIDTYKAPVAQYALENGFQIVNDVTALRGDPDMIDVLIRYQPYVVLMYSKDDTPRTTTEKVEYDDVIASIKTFLIGQIVDLIDAGFDEDKIIIDPGMGMFVSAEPKYSFEIIERLLELKQLGYPILVGVSRKSFLGGELEERDKPSVELSLKAIQNGASIVRMHAVEEMKKDLN